MVDEGEAPQTLGLTREVEVNKRNISQKAIDKGGVVFRDKPTPDNFKGQLKEKLFITETLLRFDSVTPSSSLEQGFNLARRYVNSLRSRLELSKLGPKDMEVLLLEEDNFNKHYKKLSSLSEVSSVGFSADILKPVVVMKLDDVPEYIMASMAFHELIHQHLETRVRVYSSEEDSNNAGYRVFTESRRTGLSVKKVNRNREKKDEQGKLGNLLNEIPNYLLQKQLLADVFKKEEFKELFSEEINRRNIRLDEYLGKGNDFLIVKLEGGRKAVLQKSVVHFDNNGRVLFEILPSTFILMQLASDLNVLCGDIDGKPFWEVLLQAKIDPRLQGKLRDEIDSKLGRGFYRKLKTAELKQEDIIDILVEVQSKLYNFYTK